MLLVSLMIDDCSSAADTPPNSPIRSTPFEASSGLCPGVLIEASGELLPLLLCSSADSGLVLHELSLLDKPVNPLANRISSSAICCPILLASVWPVMTRCRSPTSTLLDASGVE